MKKYLLWGVALLAALTLTACEGTDGGSVTETANETTVEKPDPTEGLEYTLNSDGASYSVSGIGTATATDIVIADTYDDLPVTGIGDRAFLECSSLTSITFQGTTAEWEAITKGTKWDSSTNTYTIHCTDGTISKDGTVTPNP